MLLVGAIRFEDRFCTSRKGGTGGGGWAHCSGRQCMAAVAAGYRMGLVSAGWPALLLSCTNGRRKLSFHRRDSISGVLGSFQSGGVFSCQRALGEWVWSGS